MTALTLDELLAKAGPRHHRPEPPEELTLDDVLAAAAAAAGPSELIGISVKALRARLGMDLVVDDDCGLVDVLSVVLVHYVATWGALSTDGVHHRAHGARALRPATDDEVMAWRVAQRADGNHESRSTVGAR